MKFFAKRQPRGNSKPVPRTLLGSVVSKASLSWFGVAWHLTFLAAVMFATPLQAALISYEGFEYTANASLNGRTGGTGWQSGWSGANNVMITTPGRTFPGLATTGNSVRTFSNLPLIRPFTTTGFTTLRTAGRFGLDGTELWLSFLARRETNFTSVDYGGVTLLDGASQELFVGCTSAGSHWSLQLFDLGNGVRLDSKVSFHRSP